MLRAVVSLPQLVKSYVNEMTLKLRAIAIQKQYGLTSSIVIDTVCGIESNHTV